MRISGHDVFQGSGAVSDRPTAQLSLKGEEGEMIGEKRMATTYPKDLGPSLTDQPRKSLPKEKKKRCESRRHDDVDDERLRLRRLKDEARNIAGDENKDRRVDYNNSLPAGCLERKRSSFPAGWSHREAASGHHGPPPVGSPEWQPRLQRQQ